MLCGKGGRAIGRGRAPPPPQNSPLPCLELLEDEVELAPELAVLSPGDAVEEHDARGDRDECADPAARRRLQHRVDGGPVHPPKVVWRNRGGGARVERRTHGGRDAAAADSPGSAAHAQGAREACILDHAADASKPSGRRGAPLTSGGGGRAGGASPGASWGGSGAGWAASWEGGAGAGGAASCGGVSGVGGAAEATAGSASAAGGAWEGTLSGLSTAMVTFRTPIELGSASTGAGTSGALEADGARGMDEERERWARSDLSLVPFAAWAPATPTTIGLGSNCDGWGEPANTDIVTAVKNKIRSTSGT